jgi:hypothetical protein
MTTGGSHRTRDVLRDQEYFDAQVEHNDETLGKFEATVADPGTAPEHRRRLLHAVFRRSLEQLIARYSRGDDPSALRALFPQTVAALTRFNAEPGHSSYDFGELDAYVVALWLVSLGILLDVEPPVFTQLVRELDNEGRDVLYEKLVAARIPARKEGAALLHPKPYQTLMEALGASGSDQMRLAATFLGGYYAALSETYWHDSHLGDDAGFFGYWCFELAAAVKCFGLSDQAVREHPLYPRDLLPIVGKA